MYPNPTQPLTSALIRKIWCAADRAEQGSVCIYTSKHNLLLAQFVQMLRQIRAREGARMLLEDHFLRVLGPGRQLCKFIREFGLGREDGCTVGCAMADVDLRF